MSGAGALHDRLLADLADFLQASGFGITRLDSVGDVQPPTFDGHRPDLLAERLMMRAPVIGEVKIGPDLRTGHTLSQLRTFSRVLVPTSPVTYAGLIVAVPGPWVASAWEALAEAGARTAKALVIGKWGEQWVITFPPPAGAASWRAFGPSIRVQSWHSAAVSSPPESGAGGVMSGTCLDVQT